MKAYMYTYYSECLDVSGQHDFDPCVVHTQTD